MERVIPWSEMKQSIESYYPVPNDPGRPPIGLDRMLRIYFFQHWFKPSDPDVELAHYESRGLNEFVGIDIGKESVPDETTTCKFRHLMERHNLVERLFQLVNGYLVENGLKVNRGTSADASIISAPETWKNHKIA